MYPVRLWRTFLEFWRMPRVCINLMHDVTKENDPFFSRLVLDFYRDARRLRTKYLLLVRRMTSGVALSHVPRTFDEYLARVEASARRNYKKAVREGCTFRRINFNDHLEEILEIRGCTDVRQGRKVPEEFLNGKIKPCADPVSLNAAHDYPYFGVFVNGKLVAYASCLVGGELCVVEHILGHADWLEKSVVPFLIIEIVRYILDHHPQVKYYAYGTYFGAGETMKRFKRKFDFLPHYVKWELGTAPISGSCDPDLIGKDKKT
jgi:hypothetical protein